MLYHSILYGTLLLFAIVTRQGQQELSSHPASTHALAHRSPGSWWNDFKSDRKSDYSDFLRDFSSSKFNYTRILKNQGYNYNDRSWHQRRLSYTDGRFEEKRRTRTAENSSMNLRAPGSKVFNFLASLALNPKSASHANAGIEQPKPNIGPKPVYANAGPSEPNNGRVDEQPGWQWDSNAPHNGISSHTAPFLQSAFHDHPSYTKWGSQRPQAPSPVKDNNYGVQQPSSWSHNQVTNHQSDAANNPSNPVNGPPNTQVPGGYYQRIGEFDNWKAEPYMPLAQDRPSNKPIHMGQNQVGQYPPHTGNLGNSQQTGFTLLPPTSAHQLKKSQGSPNGVDDITSESPARSPDTLIRAIANNGRSFSFDF
ncbi:hypothetical protein H4R33_003510 [Dimargaris cristalligena]|nr:hypothetical protein H4R33_003510 [Dimargaris cristalligena]